MRPLAKDEERVAFWHRHTLSGIALCVVLPALVAVRTLLTPDPANGGWLLALAAAVALPSPLLLLVPVERLVRHPRGRLFFDLWEAVGIVLAIVFCMLDGGVTSPYVFFLFVLMAHAALAYPPMGVAIAGATIVFGYLTMGLLSGGLPPQDLALGALTLAVTTGVCAFASSNHVRAYERTAVYARELAALVERDGLTGTLNHRAFHERLQLETRRATPDHPVSLLIVDVDRFKTVNDTYGHPTGDTVLQLIGGILDGLTRPGDTAGRLGGDEFALLLPGADAARATAVGRRLCDEVRAAASAWDATVSVGSATVTSPDVTELHAAADAAAYRAKRDGRDRVVDASAAPVAQPTAPGHTR